MKIFDVIAELQKKADEEGNVEVYIAKSGYSTDFVLDSVEVETAREEAGYNTRPKRIVLS